MILYSLIVLMYAPAVAQTEQTTYYGQFEQDKWLESNVFKGKRNGIFVDVGAYDGIEGSNTYFFAKERGWTGICVEPQPDLYELVVARRPECVPIKACITDKEGTVKFLYVKGLAAKQLSGIFELYDPRHLQKIEGALAVYGGEKELIEVATIPLATVLQQNNIKHVDYLSIDVEGAEMLVLKSIDFNACAIDVISVEVNYDGGEIGEFLRAHDFTYRATIGMDEIWISKSMIEQRYKKEL